MENKELTAIQEHIKWLEEVIKISEQKRLNSQIIETLDYVLLAAESKLEKEKQQIINAYADGQYLNSISLTKRMCFDNAESYYNETYKADAFTEQMSMMKNFIKKGGDK